MQLRVNAAAVAPCAIFFALAACRGDAEALVKKPPTLAETTAGAAANIPFNLHILVDQFGYRPNDPKVAVVRTPHVGFDASDTFTPGRRYEVRRTKDGKAVFSGTLAAWNDGAVQASSGDSGWWFDFSAVTVPDKYFIVDVERNQRSATFDVNDHVYKDVLKAAVRMFFYQRSGVAKQQPWAEACWADGAAYLGKSQDAEARDITDRDNSAKARNVSGGWFDAGDTNKYVTFAAQPVHQLLTAYQEFPAAFTDDFNIPESGNGIPDVLDEIKWETDWLKKMQYTDGSVALKVGEIEIKTASPPSSDSTARFYIPACTSSTISAAGMFAHAAYVYGKLPALAAESEDLKRRAIAAWNNYAGIQPKQVDCDTGVVQAGDADLKSDEQEQLATVAAIYLYAITQNSAYQDHIRQHYREMRPYNDMGWSRYGAHQGEALLFYTTLPNADADLKKTILGDKLNDVKNGNQIYGFNAGDDLYRAFLHDPQYHWGSNNPRANYGNSNVDVTTHDLGIADITTYRTRALETLHYFHGVNPFGMVYLSNMYQYGATVSANEIYHTWFQPKTKWSDAKTSLCGPPPGYVPGGPNASAEANGVPVRLKPPTGQPPQKSYKDWNENWPESAWAVTEPAIYYQSAYVKLVSAFAR